MKKWAKELTEAEGWQQEREGLEVKICAGPDGNETFLLCRSEDRQRKEQAMHDRFSERIRQQLVSLARRLKRARKPANRNDVERQIGRILERNIRAGKKFQVKVLVDPLRSSTPRLNWTERKDWKQWATLTEGTYIMRSNVDDWSAEELWQTYVQLYHAEAAFRVHKSDLSIRPIWHQKQERVQAHILVCFLAYCLWKTLEGWQERAGLGNSPRTILEDLARIQCVGVLLLVVDGAELRLRCVVEPDHAQAALLDPLGLRLPKRDRVPETVECSGNSG